MRKALVVGYYGYDNLGDEYLLKSVVRILKEIDSNCQITAFYRKNQVKLVGIDKVFNKYNILKLIKAIKESDFVVFGGGNLLQNETSNRNLLFFSFIIFLAKVFKKKVVFISQGIGPVKGIGRFVINYVLRKFDNVCGILRDYTSFKYSRKFSNNFKLGTDIGFYSVLDTIENLRIQSKKRRNLVLILKYKPNLEVLEKVIEAYDYNNLFVVIANKSDIDLKTGNFVYENLKNTINTYIVEEDFDIFKTVANSSLVISDRLHGALLALILATPFLTYKNRKNVRVLTTIEKKYRFFYNSMHDIPHLIIQTEKFDFENMRSKFVEQVHRSVQTIQDLIKNLQ